MMFVSLKRDHKWTRVVVLCATGSTKSIIQAAGGVK